VIVQSYRKIQGRESGKQAGWGGGLGWMGGREGAGIADRGAGWWKWC
jgi:hypothetical protein